MLNFTKLRIEIISEINPRSVAYNSFVGNKQVTHFRTNKIITCALNITYFSTVVFTNRPLHNFKLNMFCCVCQAGSLGKLFVRISGLKRPVIKKFPVPEVVVARQVIIETCHTVVHGCIGRLIEIFLVNENKSDV